MFLCSVKNGKGVEISSFAAQNVTQMEIIALGKAETHFVDENNLRGKRSVVEKGGKWRRRSTGIKTLTLKQEMPASTIEEVFTLEYHRG